MRVVETSIMTSWKADRLEQLPPYLFVAIDRKKRAAAAAGKDVIDLGIGDPDQPTPAFVVESMSRAIRDPKNHRYPSGAGGVEFREACASFFERRYGIRLDVDTQITALIGSKEGIGHLPLAIVNPGERVLIPDPGYPVYTSATIFAGGVPQVMPLSADRGWLPDLEAIDSETAQASKIMFLNYPNNPTAASAPLSFFQRAVEFAQEHGILIAHDAAYGEVFFETKPPSILEVRGAERCAIEFHSLSKTFCMTGWRIGFAVGNPEAIAALAKVKDNLDSGPFGAIQQAAAEALRHSDHVDVRATVDEYRERRDVAVRGLLAMGLAVDKPEASFYVWVRCPDGHTSMDFATRLLEEAAVVVIPGVGFGPWGEGYFRIALTVDSRRIAEAMERIARVSW